MSAEGLMAADVPQATARVAAAAAAAAAEPLVGKVVLLVAASAGLSVLRYGAGREGVLVLLV